MADTGSETLEVDLLVVGSGGGGLTAMLTALDAGYTPLLIEKTELLGGSTALSGGQIWLPGNHYMLSAGVDDSLERGIEYLEAAVGDAGPGTTAARKEAFVRGGATLLEFLEREGLRFRYSPSPDDYSDLPGGSVDGRAIEAESVKRSDLAGWESWLRFGGWLPLPMFVHEAPDAALAFRTPGHFLGMCRLIARAIKAKVQGEAPLTMGLALVTQLLMALQRRGAWIWRSTGMEELIVEDGRVAGVIANRDGKRVEIRSRHGVLLTCGGFGHNSEMRQREQAAPISGQWTLTAPGDTGDGIALGKDLGAAVSNLDEAIWLPAPVLNGQPWVGAIWERSLPHAIIVDQSGERYMNEALPYMEAGQEQLKRNETTPAVPSWLIIDDNHRRRYPFLVAPPRKTPGEWIESGFMKRADTIAGLADACGIDRSALRRTVDRFNPMAEKGRDDDFGRGTTGYERKFGDPTNKPSPNLGTIARAPFYAVELVVTDVGTVGGLVADEHSRVLREDGSVIDGLYASGTGSASVGGRVYPAPGLSVAATLVFGYLAAKHALSLDRVPA
jgi:3-oxosteroid 1-dehydrogenase